MNEYPGRHGFELNGQFVESGIIRSFHPLMDVASWIVQEGEEPGGEELDVWPVIGTALCEFPDEDGGASHCALILAAITMWGVELFDGAAPGGNGFLGVSFNWPHDRTVWLDRAAQKRKGSLTHGKADTHGTGGGQDIPDAHEGQWDDSERGVLGSQHFRGQVTVAGRGEAGASDAGASDAGLRSDPERPAGEADRAGRRPGDRESGAGWPADERPESESR